MKIHNNNKPKFTIAFKSINFKKTGDIKIFNDFHAKLINNNNEMDCFVKMKTRPNRFYISVDTSDNRNLGQSVCNTLHKGMLYNCIINNNSYIPTIKGIGSTMHLSQIIMMLENNIPKIQLYSMPQAVYFHSKFKFEPAITNLEEIKRLLIKNILQPRVGEQRFNKFVSEVTNCMNASSLTPQEKLKQGNQILYKYIEAVNTYKLNTDKNYRLSAGFDMTLPKEKVIKYKEFFNNMFEKYGIDYKISSPCAY